jgi:V-type H+-transporting ATPase proteolipid subunit
MSGLGATAAIFFSSLGSAIASAKGGLFATKSSSSGLWSYSAIVIAGVLAIYGLIIAVLIQGQMMTTTTTTTTNDDDIHTGYRHLCAGLVVGLGCFSSGLGMSHYLDLYMKHHTKEGYEYGSTIRGRATTGDDTNTDETSALMGRNTNASEGNIGNLPVTWTLLYSMVFLEAIGLYSLIVALFMTGPTTVN